MTDNATKPTLEEVREAFQSSGEGLDFKRTFNAQGAAFDRFMAGYTPISSETTENETDKIRLKEINALPVGSILKFTLRSDATQTQVGIKVLSDYGFAGVVLGWEISSVGYLLEGHIEEFLKCWEPTLLEHETDRNEIVLKMSESK